MEGLRPQRPQGRIGGNKKIERDAAKTVDRFVVQSSRTRLLLNGAPGDLRSWVLNPLPSQLLLCTVIIVAGAGLYGATMGWWRAPRQGLFVALKFPLILLATTAGNSLLNAMLAPLLGLNIGIRQSFAAVLLSFAIAAAILGGFAPVTGWMILNAPPLAAAGKAGAMGVHSSILLMHVAVIAFAGIVSNLHLLRLLTALSGSARVGQRVLVAWLAGNLFLGSQLSWIARPFIGNPGLPVEFLRSDAFHGNFYETVFRSLLHILNLA